MSPVAALLHQGWGQAVEGSRKGQGSAMGMQRAVSDAVQGPPGSPKACCVTCAVELSKNVVLHARVGFSTPPCLHMHHRL